ncbi:MAG: DUF3883 domain-containing protein [Chitinophagales bacterium]|nr:DUF3883 domain-containing protein [Chitinophagales bacterium]
MSMLSNRKTAILMGLYLSKFDEMAIQALGFKGSVEAFNTLGYAIGTKPASIKNYRDEFDPYFNNPRKGWHNRPLREYCKLVLEEYQNVDFNEFTELIKSNLIENYPVEQFVDSILQRDHSESVAKRLVTGKAAEEFFRENYLSIPQFENFTLKDATLLACGFDFKLEKESDYYCVEVKGLQGKSGTVTFTEKEYAMAEKLCDAFALYVVTNFVEKPTPKLIFNPLKSALRFMKTEKLINQISFSASF